MRASLFSRRELLSKKILVKLFSRSFLEYLDLFRMVQNNKGPVFGLSMYQMLSDSGITLNYHIDASHKKSGNMRLFEATGVGACLVTDWKENLKDFFEADKEVVVFHTPEECIDKVNYLLTHEKERSSIASAGQKKTLRHHNFRDKMESFTKIISTIL